jgi:hypothetical protein
MTDCKHDWHFIEGTDRLQCARCKAETGPRTYDQLTRDMFEDITVPTEQMQGYKLHDPRPNSVMFFGTINGEQTEVMRISKDGIWANPDVPTDDAAKALLEALDVHIRMMVDRELDREIEACAAIAHEAEPYQAADLIRKRKRP